MDLSRQVISLEQAKRLKELGIAQESYFSWFGDENKRLMDNGKDGMTVSDWTFVSVTQPINNQQADHRENTCTTKPIAAAHTVAELGEMLPDLIEQENKQFELVCIKEDDCWLCRYVRGNNILDCFHYTAGETEAAARANMLEYLLESNLTTIEAINSIVCKIHFNGQMIWFTSSLTSYATVMLLGITFSNSNLPNPQRKNGR